MRRFGILPLVLLATAPSAFGQTLEPPNRTGSEQVVFAVTASEIETMLVNAGFSVERGTEDGEPFVLGTTDTGFPLLAVLALCDQDGGPDGCFGVSFSTQWTLPIEDAQRVKSLVDETSFSTSTLSENGIVLQRYVMTDGGVTLANIENNLIEFLIHIVSIANDVETRFGLTLDRP